MLTSLWEQGGVDEMSLWHWRQPKKTHALKTQCHKAQPASYS